MNKNKSMTEDTEDIWRTAVDHLLIINWIGTTDGVKTVEGALEKLAELIEWEIKIATDPKVNGGYELRKIEKREIT